MEGVFLAQEGIRQLVAPEEHDRVGVPRGVHQQGFPLFVGGLDLLSESSCAQGLQK